MSPADTVDIYVDGSGQPTRNNQLRDPFLDVWRKLIQEFLVQSIVAAYVKVNRTKFITIVLLPAFQSILEDFFSQIPRHLLAL